MTFVRLGKVRVIFDPRGNLRRTICQLWRTDLRCNLALISSTIWGSDSRKSWLLKWFFNRLWRNWSIGCACLVVPTGNNKKSVSSEWNVKTDLRYRSWSRITVFIPWSGWIFSICLLKKSLKLFAFAYPFLEYDSNGFADCQTWYILCGYTKVKTEEPNDEIAKCKVILPCKVFRAVV